LSQLWNFKSFFSQVLEKTNRQWKECDIHPNIFQVTTHLGKVKGPLRSDNTLFLYRLKNISAKSQEERTVTFKTLDLEF
jgi:hypothetical protein